MSSDVTIKIGADVSELEKSMAQAGKSIFGTVNGSVSALTGATGGGGGAKPPPLPKQQSLNQKLGNLAGGSFGAIGAMIPIPGAALVGQIIDTVIGVFQTIDGWIKQLTQSAKELHNLSIATGLTTAELQKLNGLAEASGIGLSTLAHAFAEFNKRLGELYIKGGNFNAIFTKLGLSVDYAKSKTVTAQQALMALTKSYEAGTDQAILAYYGNQLFGSSFESLLPIIKRGSGAMKTFGEETYERSEESIIALDRLHHTWTWFWDSIGNIMLDMLGKIASRYEWLHDKIILTDTYLISKASPSLAGKFASTMISPVMSKEDRKAFSDKIISTMNSEDAKKFLEEFNGSGVGNKLNAFGFQTAQGASNLQQMGGGDIVSAMAFSPLERIANATEGSEKSLETLVENKQDSHDWGIKQIDITTF
jgi:hypothetical protein